MSFLEVSTMKMMADACFEFSDLASKRLGIFFTISSYTSFFARLCFQIGHAFSRKLSVHIPFVLYFDVHTNTPRCWCVWMC